MSKIVKISLWSAGVVGILLLALHLLISFRSRQLVEKVVRELSDGAYTASVKDATFTYFPASIDVRGLQVWPLQKKERPFYLKSDRVHLSLGSLAALLLNKKMSVRLLRIENPEVVIRGVSSKQDTKKTLSQALKDIQQGMFRMFTTLKVKDASLTNGSLQIQTGQQADDYFAVNHIGIQLKDILLRPDDNQDDIPEFEGSVILGLSKPDIHFGNDALQLQLGNLMANSTHRSLSIDSMRFRYAVNNEQVDTVSLSSIVINRLNWLRFLKDGTMELDSVLIERGQSWLNFFNPDKTLEERPAAAGPPKIYYGPSFQVHHLSISDVSYALKTREWIKRRPFNTMMHFHGDSLALTNLSITSGKHPALDVEALRINITNFSDDNALKTYTSSLGAIEVTNNTLVLKSYQIKALKGGNQSPNNFISLPELRLQGYSLEDLLLRKLVADKLVLNKPEVVLDILQKDRTNNPQAIDINESIRNQAADISKKVAIGKLEVNDASLILKPERNKNNDIVIAGLSFSLNGKQALASGNFVDLMNSILQFSTEGFRISTAGMDLYVKDLKLMPKEHGIYFGQVTGSFGENAQIQLQGVTVLNRYGSFDITRKDGLHASDILVESGTVSIFTNDKNVKTLPAARKPAPPVMADNIDLRNIVFKLQQAGQVGVGSALHVQATQAQFVDGIASWQTLNVTGVSNDMNMQGLQFHAGEMHLQQPGVLLFTHVNSLWKTPTAKTSIEADAMKIGFAINSSQIPELRIADVVLSKPNISIALKRRDHQSSPGPSNTRPVKKSLFLQHLQLDDASIEFNLFKNDSSQLVKARTLHGNFDMRNFELVNLGSHPLLQVEQINYNTRQVQADVAAHLFSPEALRLKASKFSTDLVDKTFHFHIDSLWLEQMSHTFFGKKDDTLQLQIQAAGITNIDYRNGDSINALQYMQHQSWWLKGSSLQYLTASHTLTVYGLDAHNRSNKNFQFDSLQWQPRLGREAFWAAHPFEKDYITLTAGKGAGTYLQTDLQENEPYFHLQRLQLNDLQLIPQRDKRKPDDTVSYRPLLAGSFLSIPPRLIIDTLQLKNGTVTYHEISERSNQEGSVMFDRITGAITNLRTFDAAPSDTLNITLTTHLYNNTPLQLHFRQAYLDTLQEFSLGVKMQPMNMVQMNQLLTPLMGIKIRSGFMESLDLSVQANKYFAFGTVSMPYHKMDISLLNKEGLDRQGFSNLVNWLANKILRNKSNGEAHLLFKERLVNKGIFNYWGRIGVESLLAGTGLKKSRKALSYFEKSTRKYKLPNDYWWQLVPAGKRKIKK